MESKTKRVANFIDADRLLLIKLANLYKNVIECKKTDAITWREKEQAWCKIELKFNSSTTGPPRTAKQLKTKYDGIKKAIKKEYSRHRCYVTGTGGGSYVSPPNPKTEDEKLLANTIAISIQGLQGTFDSDSLSGMSGITFENNSTNSEEIEIINDWTPPSTNLLRTPVNAKLRPDGDKCKVDNISDCDTQNISLILENNITSLDAAEFNQETIAQNDHTYQMSENTDTEKKSWSSRRRPTLSTKKRCVSSVAGKFEVLAEDKCKLVTLRTRIAEEELLYIKKEHDAKMKILELQIQQEEMKLALLKQ